MLYDSNVVLLTEASNFEDASNTTLKIRSFANQPQE